MKRVARAFTLFIASSAYVWLLFLTATSVSTYLALHQPTTMKRWLDESGVYGKIVDEVSKLATIQQKQENSLVQITSEDIRSTAQQTFTPESIKTDTEGLIDGFYGWFRGETTGPEFSVDFSGRQASFASAMTAKLEQKINALPECENTGRFTVQAFDPFKAECRPKGIDLTEELSSFEQELATSKDILPQVVFTGDDLKIHNKNGEPQRLASALPWVPDAYKGLTYGPWVIAGLALLSGVTIIFMSSSRRKGLRRFANGLFFTATVLLISGLFLRPAFEKLNGWSTRSLGAQASFTQNVVDPIFREVNITYSRYSVLFGIGFMIPSLFIYSALILTRHKKDDQDETQGAESNDIVSSLESSDKHVEEVPVQPQTSQPAPKVERPVMSPQPQSANPSPQPNSQTIAPRHHPQPGRTYERRPPMIQG